MYQIKLTDAEMQTLGWLTDRGYFPEETYLGMGISEKDDHEYFSDTSYERKHREWTWEIEEHHAWAILTHREADPHSLYTCCDEPLLSKLLELEGRIV